MNTITGSTGFGSFSNQGTQTQQATPTQQAVTPVFSGGIKGNSLPDPDPKPAFWTTTVDHNETPYDDGKRHYENFTDDRGDTVSYTYSQQGKRTDEYDTAVGAARMHYTFDDHGNRSKPKYSPPYY
jgi:hypothetical protein